MFFAKNDKTCNEFREALTNDLVSKIYYARVLGNFEEKCTDKEVTVEKWIYCKSHMQMLYGCDDPDNLTED